MIPFNLLAPQHQNLRAELLAATARVIDSGWFVLGPEVSAFEAAFAASCGCGYGVGVASGTDAIQLGLTALGVKAGDEVLTVAHTAVPTISAIYAAGAHPVLIDVNATSMTMDPGRIEERITARTRAIVPVHLYGHPCDMDPILAIARLHNFVVLEDAAQAHGARYKGRQVGMLGDACAWSFYPTKNLGALGDAGMVTTNDGAVADRLRQLRFYGQTKRYIHEIPGTNSRLDEMQAAYLSVKLPYLAKWNAARLGLARVYGRELADLSGLTLPTASEGIEHAFHLYVLQVSGRDAFQRALLDGGIGTLIHYPIPVHKQAAYPELRDQGRFLPVTERLADRIISLPLYPELPESDVLTVARTIARVLC